MNWRQMWKNSRSTIISGIIAIVVIAGLFILFNAIPSNQTAKKSSDQKTTQQSSQKKTENKNPSATSLPTTYTVAVGDSLWKISSKFYGSGYSWVVISQENKLANPDVIHKGNVLTIPKAQIVTAATTTAKTYTVVKGDSLWSISEKYLGSGFQWTKIRDANPGKIGTLSNGRPLIKPGQVLKIP